MPELTDQQIEAKISSARTRLILDKPFLGALVLRLPVEEGDPSWCRTIATDARKFYYNRDYISELRISEMQFVIAHEALHCALLHFARRQSRDKHRWDLACDFAINPLLMADGLEPPPDALYLREYDGMTAEEIYPCLDDSDNESETFDQHLYDGENQQDQGDAGSSREASLKEKQGDEGGEASSSEPTTGNAGSKGAPAPLTEQERQALSTQWQQRLAGAAQQAMQAGKLGEKMARLVDLMLEPQLSWRHLLTRFLSQRAREDYSYTRPSTRRGDPAVFPSLRSGELDLAIALDTSGSLTDADISAFVSEVNAIKGYLRARITLLFCDADLDSENVKVFDYWEDFSLTVNISGGGGTNFKPVFNYLEHQDRPPDVLVYFTDAKGQFPADPSPWVTLWLVKGSAPVPFGQRIQLN